MESYELSTDVGSVNVTFKFEILHTIVHMKSNLIDIYVPEGVLVFQGIPKNLCPMKTVKFAIVANNKHACVQISTDGTIKIFDKIPPFESGFPAGSLSINPFEFCWLVDNEKP